MLRSNPLNLMQLVLPKGKVKWFPISWPFLKQNFKGMEITVNNQKKNMKEQITVQRLLDLEIPGRQKGIAVAINNSVIPKAGWALQVIKENDIILIIKATQGG